MASVKDNLIAARALIDTPEKWGKGSLANSELTCFCAMGAIGQVVPRFRLTSETAEFAALTYALPQGAICVPQFNDDPATTHADILALFDRAISSQEQSE